MSHKCVYDNGDEGHDKMSFTEAKNIFCKK